MGFMGNKDGGSADHPAEDTDDRGTEHGEAKDLETVSDGFSVRDGNWNRHIYHLPLARAEAEQQES